MTLTKLRSLCKQWQEILKINDWTISIRFARDGELPEEYGINSWDPRQMISRIVIREGSADVGYPDGGVEQTIIHELLHLVLNGNTDYETENILEERAINQIADAMYWLSYSKKRKR